MCILILGCFVKGFCREQNGYRFFFGLFVKNSVEQLNE
jgi:hypothetical protein